MFFHPKLCIGFCSGDCLCSGVNFLRAQMWGTPSSSLAELRGHRDILVANRGPLLLAQGPCFAVLLSILFLVLPRVRTSLSATPVDLSRYCQMTPCHEGLLLANCESGCHHGGRTLIRHLSLIRCSRSNMEGF